MSHVQTVLGRVPADKLGRTLVHEHIRISYPGAELDPNGRYDRPESVARAVERMQGLLAHGVRTLVDPCPIELGRDPELMAEVAQRSGMQIICATGFYHEHVGIPWYWRVRSSEEIAELYLHEIENGIGKTGIKPGCIKIASFDPPGHHDERTLHGAAIAAKASGLPIISHCENANGGDVQQNILAEHGVDLSRCLIGHQGQAPNVAQHVTIAMRGSFVGYDRIGIQSLATDEHHADLIKQMIDAGHVNRICLSQDHTCCWHSPRFSYPLPRGMDRKLFETQIQPFVDEQVFGRPHTYLFTDFLPRLRALGIDDATIDAMLVDNPRRLLAGVAA